MKMKGRLEIIREGSSKKKIKRTTERIRRAI